VTKINNGVVRPAHRARYDVVFLHIKHNQALAYV